MGRESGESILAPDSNFVNRVSLTEFMNVSRKGIIAGAQSVLCQDEEEW